MKKTVVCPECLGKGVVAPKRNDLNLPRRRCRKCNGSGYVVVDMGIDTTLHDPERLGWEM